MKEIRVTRNYSFWRHPIQWFKDRRKIHLLDMLVNHEWEHGLKEEIQKGMFDVVMKGGTVFKNGKHVSLENFRE